MLITTIKKQSVFVQLNKKGQKFYTPYFILIYHKNFTPYETPISSYILLGIKVTTKVGNAVVRNKIRRRIKHLTRLLTKVLMPGKHGILIIPRRGFENVEFSLLFAELQNFMNPDIINHSKIHCNNKKYYAN